MTKTLLTLLASAFLTTTALAADVPKKQEEKAPAKAEEKVATKKEEKAPAKKEEVKKEKACIDKVKDGKPVVGKDGKPEQICKEVKIHEKLDGHKVPDKK